MTEQEAPYLPRRKLEEEKEITLTITRIHKLTHTHTHTKHTHALNLTLTHTHSHVKFLKGVVKGKNDTITDLFTLTLASG